jgi:hypothetical protein
MHYQTHFLYAWRNSSASLAYVILLLIFTTTFTSSIWAVNCTPNEITLSTQSEVNDFQLNHGPCDQVESDLTIVGNDIVNLDGLSAITTVGGMLEISHNPELINLDDLPLLTSVGILLISLNDKLTHIDGLNALTRIDEWLVIDYHRELRDINGLASLNAVGDDLFIRLNNYLNSIDGLSSLTSVGGLLLIRFNTVLENLDGLSGLTNAGSLEIKRNHYLENLNGLSQLTSVGGDLMIEENRWLAQCSSISKLVDQIDDAEPGPGPGVGGVPDVGGDILVGENRPGCNTINEILAAVPLLKMNAGLNDAWYDPETDGQGFFITVFPDLNAVSLAWFTYDTELPAEDATANLGDPGHRWFTAVGPIEGNQAIMQIEMTSGGLFDTPTEIQRTELPGSDGTIILTFNSCYSGTVEYDIPSINKQGYVPIQRVAGDNIVLCEALSTD